MSIFNLYFKIGFEHITDIVGYDHILFLLTLVSVYAISQWKQLLILITAFTIGHSITLVLSVLEIFVIKSSIIEVLIPITILFTSVLNLFQTSNKVSKGFHLFKYILALFFGLIHGMGFSNYLRSLLGSEDNLLMPLLGFNLGLELGQIIVVFVVILLSMLFINIIKVKYREWNLVLSGAGIGIALILILERLSNL